MASFPIGFTTNIPSCVSSYIIPISFARLAFVYIYGNISKQSFFFFVTQRRYYFKFIEAK